MAVDVNVPGGLSSEEAARRLDKYGPNQAAKPHEVRFIDIVKEEIAEPMIMLLLFVGFVYAVWGNLEDALTILVVILVLVLVEVWNEYRAKKAINALSMIAAPKTRVLRDGVVKDVDTVLIVPGDALILAPGTRITADGAVDASYSLQVDESSLTGESFPVEKKAGDPIYAGTLVVSGEGRAVSKATGRDTRMGKIAETAAYIKPPKTPLQLAMKTLSKQLVYVALFFCLTITLVGFLESADYRTLAGSGVTDPAKILQSLLNSQDLRTMILTGLSLAFATIPEELPIIITMVLGLGAYTLSKDRLLIKKLKAAEALGNASVIVTDKTGTITENKMLIAGIYPAEKEKEILASALSAATDVSSTPIDKAVMRKAADYGLKYGIGKIIRERSFGDGRKTKSILRERAGKFVLYVSGAPEEILELAAGDRSFYEKTLEKEAEKGRRLIAVAEKSVLAKDRDRPFAELEKGASVMGLISFEDPARKGVDETIQKASRAGIRTIMVTGDHPKTAAYIAGFVGIPNDKVLTGDDLDMLSEEGLQKMVRTVSVYARTTPEHKYRIVSALQKNGEVVAVTGDGVNDTLALKEADIGIAMGIRGTDAAKEAADIVLADDNFVTIGKGIFEGRKFYDNLRKGVKYYLSVKTALVLIFLMPILLNLPFLLAPIQIIILELFMDLAASSAFVAEPAEKTIYTRPPKKPGEKFIDGRLLTEILISGISLFAAIALSYYYAGTQNVNPALMQTYAFTAWIIGHMVLAFISRSETDPLYKLGLFSNKVMNYWALIVVIFLAVVMGVPQAGAQLRVTPLDLMHIAVIAGICLVAICWQEAAKTITYNMKKVRG